MLKFFEKVFAFDTKGGKARLRELNSSRSSCASAERPFAEFAHPILEHKCSSDGLDSSSHIKHKRPSRLTRSFVFVSNIKF